MWKISIKKTFSLVWLFFYFVLLKIFFNFEKNTKDGYWQRKKWEYRETEKEVEMRRKKKVVFEETQRKEKYSTLEVLFWKSLYCVLQILPFRLHLHYFKHCMYSLDFFFLVGSFLLLLWRWWGKKSVCYNNNNKKVSFAVFVFLIFVKQKL